jgi:hypothetical protein
MKRTIAERLHAYLVEPDGQQFVAGKWRFWFVAIAFLSVINAALTWLIFRDDGENYSGPIMLSVGALVAWLCVGALHYSDSSNRQLARGVSAVDSIALLFVVIHFSGLLYVYGHHRTLRAAEARYEQAAVAYNAKAEKVSTDNVEIARAAREIATENRKRAKLENDTAYQQRKTAEAGGRLPGSRPAPATIGAGLTTSQIELERPMKPEESSAAFLGQWDWLIRAANCGELLLACLTLILIRNVSAKTNSPVEKLGTIVPNFSTAAYRSPLSQPAFSNDTVSLKRDDTDDEKKATRVVNREGLKRLRETLKEIAFQYGPCHFKTDPKPEIGAIWIRQYKSSHGVAREVAGVKSKLEILNDALKMEREAFRERLEKFLRENGFEI